MVNRLSVWLRGDPLGSLARRLTHRRSNGVPVPKAVYLAIKQGDRARSAGQWPAAAAAYHAALAHMPTLAHIWLQAGHAAKESGSLGMASSAYERAAALSPQDEEPHIHLGHVSKLNGNLPVAAAYYLEALRRKPNSLAAASELIRTVSGNSEEGGALLVAAIQLTGIDIERDLRKIPAAPGRAAGIFFDVTDLLGYFSHARLPTGIQRVQIELVQAALDVSENAEVKAEACCFSEAAGGWSVIPNESFRTLARAALESDDRADPSWQRIVISVLLKNALEPQIDFGRHSVLVNVGASWSERNYFLHVRNARERGGPLYTPLIHDCIPMVHPEWFPGALVRDYRAWLSGVLFHADGFFAVSKATAADLKRFAVDCHPTVMPPIVNITSPDGDFERHGDEPKETVLNRLGLSGDQFVLMVSTLEPRKNHVGAFAAWRSLLEKWPAHKVPTLVCVGGRGWMNEAPYAMLNANSRLRRKVRILHGVSDADLSILYSTCLFTLYPSFYEGWGLPITEALCYGKVPVTSNTTSMPEAGGKFAVYFDPHDPHSIAREVARLIENEEERQALEGRIAAEFSPQSWSKKATDMMAQLARLAGSCEPDPILPQNLDITQRLSFAASPDGKEASAEMLRTGTGWAPPGPLGSGVLRGGGELRLPGSIHRRHHIWLGLIAPPGEAREISIETSGRRIVETRMPGGTSRTVEFDLVSGDDRAPSFKIIDSYAQSDSGNGGVETGALLVSDIRARPIMPKS